jgi:hypothetical protein
VHIAEACSTAAFSAVKPADRWPLVCLKSLKFFKHLLAASSELDWTGLYVVVSTAQSVAVAIIAGSSVAVIKHMSTQRYIAGMRRSRS